ncbi:Vacuolar protein sorting-associated protein 1 [Colletotrichum sidae]|uniref:Vacuolar protein sorting-associated protein 1 n=1 Tax=Colletotrichum sidae TaxID=1347389 RepID=A0A4R8TEN9_9PEZI|nr:Vacuolar protein sorting-associated protein 1 [Colletotrichum sidae]
MAPSFIEASESSKQGVRQFTFRMPHKRSSDQESGASENEAWSDNESQVDSSASGASSPGLAPETRSPQFPPHSRDITENPFDSESSRILFDAIDQLQSCGVSEKLDIPQLVIVGGQSTGKSSLLQSLTDIPFPVGSGCCTRFATRIVSRRTAHGSNNAVRITISDPEVKDSFNYPPDSGYKKYECNCSRLGVEDFQVIVDEISTKYMGIKAGEGEGKKNFASQVLRIELSGPSRSHFSILDVPGYITNAYKVNEEEIHGITQMVKAYMKQPANIVVCVADATTDLANQGIFRLASKIVDEKRLVGVFTKCDRLTDPSEVISIASGNSTMRSKTMRDGWFVVRNRIDTDGADFDLDEAERKLFDQAPWTKIRNDRRSTKSLRNFLGNLLCARIRSRFPTIQERVSGLLEIAETDRKALGDDRPEHNQRQQYLREVVERYHTMAVQSLKCPGYLSDEDLRVRGLVRGANETFAAEMRDEGHHLNFQDPDVSPSEKIIEIVSVIEGKSLPAQGDSSITPPSTPPRNRRQHATLQAEPRELPIFTQIHQQLNIWQTTELPGFVNTKVIEVCYHQQSSPWLRIAQDHLATVRTIIEDASQKMLESACKPGGSSSVVIEELSEVLRRFQNRTMERATKELEEHWRRERESPLQTTDNRFEKLVSEHRQLRLLNAWTTMPTQTGDLAEPAHLPDQSGTI